MKNNTNIYDVDGELIRAFGDNHKMTIEEAQEKIEQYKKKIEEVGEDSEKAKIYATYMRNLTRYVWEQYAKMTPQQLNDALTAAQKEKSVQEQVENAINELKKEVEDENDGKTEENTSDEVLRTVPRDTEDSTNGESGDDSTIGREQSDIHEEGPTTQSDLLVERSDVNNSMDEYIDYEEV